MENSIDIYNNKLDLFKTVMRVDSRKVKYIKEKYDTSSFGNLKKSMDIFDLPIDKRIKKSKFTKLVKDLSNEELRILMFVLCENDKIRDLIKCHHSALEDPLHILSILEEIKIRSKND